MRVPLIASAAALAAVVAAGQMTGGDPHARDIFKQLIEINTTDSVGDVTKAATAMADRLKAGGFSDADIQVIGPNPRKHNLVARYHGSGARKPLLLLAHLDVVEARREDWSVDPFVFLERDGYYYGRGTTDDKAMASALVANLLRLKQEHYTPDRDLILALTADEEGGKFNGVDWLVSNHRDLIDAELALNEGGAGQMKDGKYLVNQVMASEKVYQDFHLEVKNPGGHSSRPVRDNAIYHLAGGLSRLAQFDFPVKMNEVTRGYFGKMAALETDSRVAADMRAVAQPTPDRSAVDRLAQSSAYYNALMRTTCVATMLGGGHAPNALPQTATANVNCRMLPGESPDAIRETLVGVFADPQIAVSFVDKAKPSPPSPLTADIVQPVESISKTLWPGVIVVPTMSTGATDGLYLRNAGIRTYGVEGLFQEMDDNRSHGKDERVGVKQYNESVEFLYRLIKSLSSHSS